MGKRRAKDTERRNGLLEQHSSFSIRDAAQLVLFLTSPIEPTPESEEAEIQYVQPFGNKEDTYRLVACYGDQHGNRTFVRIAENTATGALWVCFRPTILEGLPGLLLRSLWDTAALWPTRRSDRCLANLYDICRAVHSKRCGDHGLSLAHQGMLNEAMENTNGRTLMDCLRDEVAKALRRKRRKNGTSVIFAGYSLGAAQALCAASMLVNPVHCVQIAGPRVAARDKAANIERRLSSCTYIGIMNDPVSDMPFGADDMSLVGRQVWVDLYSHSFHVGSPVRERTRQNMLRFVAEVSLALLFGVRRGLSDIANALLDVHLEAEDKLYELLCSERILKSI
ncbi:uncharacterized protein EV422DRAFT_503571 [Fimicolochytrium jonesii]|uniref:uncharacterized protein n=1 Tax=Fimicolochytrium jonesii TaxID=1396493 RepID=UPI0022FDCEC3|nr:uncharacterized protein EV422DRAFT_503571 [Fimicolochytrium jonesii]KAI8826289.1 hypothetical protein EV422DRAFT_503571 [Fimicolochytrium jonesii]